MTDRAYMGFRIIDCPEDQRDKFESFVTAVIGLEESFDKNLFDAA